MKPRLLFSCLLLIWALPALARDLKPLGPADLVKLKGPSGVVLPVTEISDAGQIAALTAFINDLPGKWGVPWYGTVPRKLFNQPTRHWRTGGNSVR